MAYGLLYWHEYNNRAGKRERVEILLKDYEGADSCIESSGADPVILKHTGERDTFDTSVIQGQELIFTFLVKPTDGTKYDVLFESEYKDYQIKYYVDEILKFQGWIKPENLTRQYFGDKYFITLSATDAIGDLKKIDFRDSDAIINGKYTLLEILKYALTLTDIELDFKIQLGSYETTYMNANECALEKIVSDTRRYLENGNPIDAYSVIEKVLKIFNLKLKQYNGYYQITNYHELNSYEFEFDWSTLTQQSRIATDNIIDLSGYDYEFNSDLIKIRPLKEIDITFRNKDLGGDVTGMDLTDWSNGSIWTIDFSNGYSVASGVVTLNSDDNTYDDSIETAEFSVTKVTEDDYLKITFDHLLSAYTSSDPLKSPLIKITITRPDATTADVYFNIKEFWQSYESTMHQSLKVIATGNYKITLSFKQSAGPSQWTTASFKIKDFAVSKIINADETENESVVYDELFTQSSGKGFETLETEVILADSGQITEAGSLLFDDSGTWKVTVDWNSYGGSEGITIMDIFARNILDNRQSYKNLLRLTIFDPGDTISFNNILEIDSRYYTFLSYERNGRKGTVISELIELVTDELNYNNITRSNLTSINGEKTTVSTVVNTLPSNVGSMAYEDTTDYYTLAQVDTLLDSYLKLSEDETITGTIKITGESKAAGRLYAGSTDPTNTTRLNYDGYFYATKLFGGLEATDIIMSNGGTIGQAAGPLLTFDDTNNYLEITGCNVGIGTANPGSKLSFGNYYINDPSPNITEQVSHIRLYELGGIYYGIGVSTSALNIAANQNIGTIRLYTNAIERLRIDNTGNVGIGTTSPNAQIESLSTTEQLRLSYDSSNYASFTVGSAGELAIEPLDFVSGFQGTDWHITNTGNAEFENVLIRGGLQVYELIINQLHYQNGGLIIGAGAGKVKTVHSSTPGSEQLYFEDPEGNSCTPFAANMIVIVQRVDLDRSTVVKKIVRQVSAIQGDMRVDLTTTTGWTTGDDTGTIAVGDEVVAIGDTGGTYDSNIYMSATDSNNPFMRVFDGVTSYSKWSLSDKTAIVLQLGNLESIASYDIVPASPGYGLYSNNVYLSGKIVATSGEIGGWTINASDITGGNATLADTGVLTLGTGDDVAILSAADATYRMWCGDATAADADFSVTKGGAMRALGCVEFGTATASVLGKNQNLAIIGPDIWENAYNGDSSGIYINRIGYDGGTTKFRDFAVYDGKGTKLFQIAGSTPAVYVGDGVNSCGFEVLKGHAQFDETIEVDGAATFDGAAEFNSTAQFDGTATFNGYVDFNDGVNCDDYFRVARLTQTQINALSPSSGMIVYNTTEGTFQGYIYNAWWNFDFSTP